ncbi:FHA domain-containing protein [Agromyces sp. MMS17-SY077]|uniref:FHA domain-containing protein n=1 Tax=Agromyces seonyuensis TaxID=2662446 RepID=A0A6I4P8S6_9MICO|nr:FHA domain-containing protein [Agromyces seonyuensis]
MDDRGIAVLRFDDGARLIAPVAGLLGRNPAPAPGETVDLVQPLEDPSRRISKTHLAVGREPGGAWLVDRGSSNGTEVTAPDGATLELVAGERVVVPYGTTVSLGGGRSFVVEPAEDRA